LWFTFNQRYNKRPDSGGFSVDTHISVKGQIVIPARIRRKLGIKEGTRIQIDVDENAYHIILTPITREYIQSLRGKYKGRGLLEALAAEKEREREL
jgi:AbrB family looped-hinge helix DNA binding protein